MAGISMFVHSISELIGSIAWPSVALCFFLTFKKEIGSLIDRLKKLTFGPNSIEAEQKIEEKVASSAADALSSTNPTQTTSITKDEVRRSIEVAALSSDVNPENIRSQIKTIAAEYEGVRANMPSGILRTRQMTAVLAKMRTLGRTAYPFRNELMKSASPGERLFAIASMQMIPDFEAIQWLASTTSAEVPFLQYQALSALLIAVRNAGPDRKEALAAAAKTAKTGLTDNDPDRSRWSLLQSIESEIAKMPGK